MTEQDRELRQANRFLLLYAFAVAGGAAAYAPFLTVLLPVRLVTMFGDDAVRVLSYCAFAGAIAASVSNITFGWLSDLTRNRRGWILAGLVASSALLVAMRYIATVPQLLAMIFAWQVALNMMLAPLGAWAGDVVPDGQKGILGGLLSFAPGVGALAGMLVTIPGLADGDERLVIVAAMVTAMVLPAVLLGRPRPIPSLMDDPAPATGPAQPGERIFGVWRMWLARLLVQLAEAALFAFLYLWLRSLDGTVSDNATAAVFAGVLFAAVPFALFTGRWSDRTGRPIVPLIVAIALGTAGLLAMAGATSVTGGIAGYVVFGVSAAVFLALHTSQTLRILPHPRHRGRDLGLFNLTNTVPSLIVPGIALALIPVFGFAPLFALLAGFAACAALLLLPLARGIPAR